MPRALILPMLCAALLGCGTDEGSSATYISASVAGFPWHAAASEGEIIYSVDDPEGPGSIFSISSQSSDGPSRFLSINLPLPGAAGSYPLGSHGAFAAYGECPAQGGIDACTIWSAIAADPGTLTITSVDSATGLIEGNFSFTGHRANGPATLAKEVIGGRFVVHFSGLGTPPA